MLLDKAVFFRGFWKDPLITDILLWQLLIDTCPLHNVFHFTCLSMPLLKHIFGNAALWRLYKSKFVLSPEKATVNM